MNKVQLFGNLGAKPELRQVGDNTVTTLSVATTEGFGDKAETSWHRVTVWGKSAEACCKFLDKGSQVAIVGRLKYGSYDKDGVTHYTTEIVADSYGGVEFARGGDKQESSAKSSRRRGRSTDDFDAQI